MNESGTLEMEMEREREKEMGKKRKCTIHSTYMYRSIV